MTRDLSLGHIRAHEQITTIHSTAEYVLPHPPHPMLGILSLCISVRSWWRATRAGPSPPPPGHTSRGGIDEWRMDGRMDGWLDGFLRFSAAEKRTDRPANQIDPAASQQAECEEGNSSPFICQLYSLSNQQKCDICSLILNID